MWLQLSDIRHQTADIGHQTAADIRHQTSDIRETGYGCSHQTADSREAGYGCRVAGRELACVGLERVGVWGSVVIGSVMDISGYKLYIIGGVLG